MLEINEIIKVLNSYDLESTSYGPTLYETKDNLGICLDIKDSTFGYLTRGFIFNNKEELDDFLGKYSWYKKNHQTYNVKLSFDDYETAFPKLIYTYQDQELTFGDMINLPKNIEIKEQTMLENTESTNYLANIEQLTNYLISLKQASYETKQKKNNLKIKENDLKYALLESLTTYYDKEKILEKKAVSLETLIMPTGDIETLKNNFLNIKDKALEELKAYLEQLINLTKEEELDEKNLLNLYSNLVYEYNIEILNKQIAFVKNKITAEKNFNLKGSKIHNIDEELKSFLKTNNNLPKMQSFLEENKTKIINKYNSLKDLNQAYSIITGKDLELKKLTSNKNLNPIEELKQEFESLNKDEKMSLVLYTSIYRPIINYLIINNYDLSNIKDHFDFSYYYEELDEIIHHPDNIHYLVNYFNILNFKNLDTYLDSLINIAKTITNLNFKLKANLTLFTLNNNSLYQELSLNPIFENNAFIIEIPKDTSLLYIPEKLIIDEESKEINILNKDTFYYKEKIMATENLKTVNKYSKKTAKNKKSGIIITKELVLDTKIAFQIGSVKGEEANG